MKSPLLFFKGKGELWKIITKCVIAYEIATVLVLIPAFYRIAGSPPYLVPLGTLFFNASGTAGNQIMGMLLNVLTMTPAAFWSGVIVKLCTVYNHARLNGHPELYSNGAGIIGAIGFGICVFVTAYYRLKYPRLYIPALQGFTMPFFIITLGAYKTEFNILDVVNTFYPVLIGGAIALIVNLVLWPETAAKAAERSIGNTMESMKSVLSFVHEDLLKNDDAGVMTGDVSASTKLQALNNKLQKDVSSMKAARQDAKYEIIVSYYKPAYYKPLHRSLYILSQDLLGFSLAIKREVRIMLEKKVKAHLDGLRKRHELANQATAVSSGRHLVEKAPKPILPTTASADLSLQTNDQLQASVLSGDTLLQGREYKDIDRLQQSIQPSLKRFLNTCILTLDQIENELVEHKAMTVNKQPQKTHSTSKIDLNAALTEFKETELVLQQEYDQSGNVPTEDHFLVFTVIFTLVEFGKELIALQNNVHELILKSNKGSWWLSRIHFPHVSINTWLSKGSAHKGNQTLSEKVILEDDQLKDMQRTTTNHEMRRPSTVAGPAELQQDTYEDDDDDDDEGSLALNRRISRIVSRIETNADASDDVLAREEQHEKEIELEEAESVPLQQIKGRYIWNKWLYKLTKWLQYGPTRYAIKFTITCELLALMAFLPIEGVNALYNNNHGQWALLSAMVVFNYTVGSTALQCIFRVIATVIGAVAGYLCLLAGHRNENPYVIAVMVLVLQIPMWYFLFDTKYPRIGFISILTLAVITNTGYVNTMDEPIFSPVWKRSITAFFAIIVVMLVDQIVWPVWARKKLRTSLADLLIATGIQYSRVVSLVCQENTSSYRYRSTFQECEANQKVLTKQMHMVHEMLILAAGEPRLTKGPFPIKEYELILEHERNILHWIQHIQKAQSFITTSVRQTIMNPVNSYRKEMAAAVHLYLFTLACALRTKSSLPASLPSAEMARRMLQTKQTMGWKKNYELLCKMSAKSIANRESAEHQVFWHTYAAGSTEVVVEQEAMGDIVARLMGQHVFKAATKDWIQSASLE
ncbi:hypothetical protein V8B55DRAFT_1394102 [Mucor lusitanicus]|uniref:Putative ER transporter 6TM N-terminal domain-containing protein n=2 Tax=Mucor circinelloides f. lusitanicus TaxID=29924 RepID=A0A162Q3Z5_MUCCL|nr:hypothetical protein MUCCIDRAFT_114980 [Mucor lusitanicus CBS 277.49]